MISKILQQSVKVADSNNTEILFATLQTILDIFPDILFVIDTNFTYVAATKSFAQHLGKASVEEIIGKTAFDLYEDKAIAQLYTEDDKKVFATKQNIIDFIEPVTDKNGNRQYHLLSKYILTNQTGEPIGILGISKNITKDIKTKQQHIQEIQFLFTLPTDAHSAILIDITDWKIIDQKFHHEKKYIPSFDSLEHMLQVARTTISNEGTEGYNFFHQFSPEFLLDLYSKGQTSLNFECQMLLSDNDSIWLLNELRLMKDPENEHLMLFLTIFDIDHKKQEEERLIKAATTDQMTKVMNRATSRKEIEKYLAGPGANGIHAAFMIDLDNFKKVNDTYGHQEGDMLLIRLARGIKSCFRESDIVARIGGDEFFVLAKNMMDPNAIKARANQLLQAARESHTPLTASLSSVSIGVSIYPKDGKTLGDLYIRADEALYKAKQLGKNQASFASEL